MECQRDRKTCAKRRRVQEQRAANQSRVKTSPNSSSKRAKAGEAQGVAWGVAQRRRESGIPWIPSHKGKGRHAGLSYVFRPWKEGTLGTQQEPILAL